MKKLLFVLFLITIFSSLFGEPFQTTKQKLKDGKNGTLPWETYKQRFSQNYNTSRNLDREIIWDNWFDPFGADGYNVRPHMAMCQDGGYAVTGYYVRNNYTEWIGYVMKISSDGEFEWADKDTLEFVPSVLHESWVVIETNDSGLINAGGGYMIKRDSEGNRIWEKDLDYAPYSMCYSHDGKIIVTGGTQDQNTLFRKIDHDGNEMLNNDFELDNSTSIRRIIPTSDNGYAMTGSITHDEGYQGDIIIVKTNSIGDTLWTHRKDGESHDSDRGNWLIENSDNELVLVGEVKIPGSVRGYIAKFDLEGELLYENILDPEIGYNCWYTIDLPEENAYLVTAAPNIIKYDYDFNVIWVEYMTTLLNYYNKLPTGYIFYSNGVHLMETDNQLVSINQEDVVKPNVALSAYPNPSAISKSNRSSSINIQYQLPENVNQAKLKIFNIKGQYIRDFKIQNSKQGEIIWDGTDLNKQFVASGVYLISMQTNNQILKTQKIIILK